MRRSARGFLLAISILNGVSGLICGALFISAPDGHLLQAGALRPIIANLPLANVFFRDFTWIGVAMLIVLGIPNTISAVLLMRRDLRQYAGTLIGGLLLLVWTGFEMVYMFNVAALGYFAVGVIAVACSVWLFGRPAPGDGQAH